MANAAYDSLLYFAVVVELAASLLSLPCRGPLIVLEGAKHPHVHLLALLIGNKLFPLWFWEVSRLTAARTPLPLCFFRPTIDKSTPL